MAYGEGATAAIQAVEAQTEAQLGEEGLEGAGQGIKGLELAVLFFPLVIRRGAAGRILDKLTGQGQGQTGGAQEFGFQDRMQRGDFAAGVLLGQAAGTMGMGEAQVAGPVDGHDEVALETEVVQGLHADEPQDVPVKQLGEGGAADVPKEVMRRCS